MRQLDRQSLNWQIRDFIRRPKLDKRWKRFLYKRRLRKQTHIFNIVNAACKEQCKGRYLYASPVGKDGKPWLKKIIERFGFDQFDYIIFAYDNIPFDEEIFQRCRIVHEEGLRWYFLKKYITPSICSAYDYIFLWCDDIDIIDFDPYRFLEIMRTNNLQLAQPALTPDSYFTFDITLQHKKYAVGRYVDFVEIMVPIFTHEALESFWNMIEPKINKWGWGYDSLARSACGYTNMGVIDCQPVKHIRPIGQKHSNIEREMDREYIMNKYVVYQPAKKVSYGALR